MSIVLSDDRRARLTHRLVGFHLDEFDEELSAFRAGKLVDFFIEILGPQIYNQAVQDARAFMQHALDDLDGEVWADGGEAPG